MPPVPEEHLVPSYPLDKTLFLLGGYTDKSVLAHAPAGGEGEGVYSVLFDPENGKLKTLSSSIVRTNPAFILKHPTLDIVYMTTEVIADSGSELVVGRLNRKTGHVEEIQRRAVHGRSTCHLEWDVDRSHLIAVSYWDSRLTTFPVDKITGLLANTSEVYADPGAEYVDKAKPDRWEHLAHRQRWPHLHQVNREPFCGGKFYMVPDLGRDQVHLFSILAGHVCKLGAVQLRKGAGPRHMDFHPRLKVAYICGELDNTITVLKFNPEVVPKVLEGNYMSDSTSDASSLLTSVQTICTVPEDLTSKSTIAEMRLHPSGQFLYVGNRGHNSIAIFRVDQDSGNLTRIGIQDSLGAFPRHFNFDNTSGFLLVGNHASDTIVAFRIEVSGLLEVVDKVEGIPSIVWVTPCRPAVGAGEEEEHCL